MSLKQLTDFLDLQPKDLRLWQTAFTHSSWLNEAGEVGDRSYEQLEFFGDALLGAMVADLLLKQRPHAAEGELSVLKAHFVRRQYLATWAKKTPIPSLLRLSNGMRRGDEKGLDSILADCVEALIAVIYLEQGWNVCQQIVEKNLVFEIPNYQDIRVHQEPKSVLQEHLAKRNFGIPIYTLKNQTEQVFTVELSFQNYRFCGEGSSIQDAQSQAATQALIALEI